MSTSSPAEGARSGRRSPRDGDATRVALMDAATSLFASQGIDGASIRSINSAAGLGPAAVHYHFGSKDGLLRAVLERDGGEVIAQIEKAENALLERAARPTAREIVEILGVPYLDLLRRDPVRGARWLKIVAELSEADDERIVRFAASATEGLRELARRAFPKASQPEVFDCLPIAFISLLVLMARAPHAAEGDLDEHVERVFQFVAAGLKTMLAGSRGDTGGGTGPRGSRASSGEPTTSPSAAGSVPRTRHAVAAARCSGSWTARPPPPTRL